MSISTAFTMGFIHKKLFIHFEKSMRGSVELADGGAQKRNIFTKELS